MKRGADYYLIYSKAFGGLLSTCFLFTYRVKCFPSYVDGNPLSFDHHVSDFCHDYTEDPHE